MDALVEQPPVTEKTRVTQSSRSSSLGHKIPQDPQVPEIAPTAPEVVDPANSGCFELLPESPDFQWTASFSEILQVP